MVTSLDDSSDSLGLGSSPTGLPLPPPLKFSRMEPVGKERGQHGVGASCSACEEAGSLCAWSLRTEPGAQGAGTPPVTSEWKEEGRTVSEQMVALVAAKGGEAGVRRPHPTRLSHCLAGPEFSPCLVLRFSSCGYNVLSIGLSSCKMPGRALTTASLSHHHPWMGIASWASGDWVYWAGCLWGGSRAPWPWKGGKAAEWAGKNEQ